MFLLPEQEEVEQRRKPKSKPANEQRSADIQNRAENRNRIRHDKRHDPEQRANAHPQPPREGIVHIDFKRLDLAHDGDVHVLDRRQADYEPRSQHRGDQDAVCNFRGDRRCGAKRRRRDRVASKSVDDARDDDVDDDLEALLHEERGREVFARVAHLGHDADEALVAGECEGDVEEGVYGFDKGGFADEGDFDVEAGGRVGARDAEGDHDDEDGGDDGDGADPGHGGCEAEFAGEAEKPADEVGNGHEGYGAEGVA